MTSRDTRLVIDTGAIQANARLLKECLGDAKLMAVVKANGYGHGIEVAARSALKGAAASLAVATAEEGVFLRECGFSEEILVMGSTTKEAARDAVRYGLTQTIYAREALPWLQHASEQLGAPALAHIQVETGMRRLGILPQKVPELLKELRLYGGIQVKGIYSHFAETSDAPFVAEQLGKYLQAADAARKALGPIDRHIASSGTALTHPETHLDLARCGIALYGYPPCDTDVPLRPAMRFVTSVVQVQHALPGDSVSYGRTFYAQRDTVIATLPVGYGDGYPRCIGNVGYALVRGRRAPVIGRVCMDLCMLDVTDIPGVQTGDEAVLMGEQGGDAVTAQDWAGWCDSIAYEALLRPTARVPRVIV